MKALVADDNKDDRAIVAAILRARGDEVFEASNGQEALEAARTFGPDVIISDAMMPKMDGFELLRAVRRSVELRDTPFFFCSAVYTGARDRELAEEMGAAGFIEKPVDPAKLSGLIESAKKGAKKRPAPDRLIEKDEEFLKDYSRIVVAKLEEKIGALEAAAQSLQRSEERFRAVAESAIDAIVCIESPGIVNFWNRRAEEMFGYSANEALGRDFTSLVVPQKYRQAEHAGLKAFFETGSGPLTGKTVEMTALRKDGTEFPVELSISAMKIRGKWQTAGIIRDITERKAAEARLKEDAELTERLFKLVYATAHEDDIDKLIGQAVESARELLGADACLSYLLDADAVTLRPVKAAGLGADQTERFSTASTGVKTGFFYLALRKGGIEVIQGFSKAAREEYAGAFDWLPETETAFIMPVGADGARAVMLCLYVARKEARGRDLEIMRSISGQVSKSLEEALSRRESAKRRLEMYRQIEKMRLMDETDRRILSTLEPRSILDTAVWMTGKVVSCDSIVACRFDPATQRLIYVAGFGLPGFEEKGSFHLSETSISGIIHAGISQYVPDLGEMEGRLPLEELFAAGGMTSRAALPLSFDEGAGGVIFAASRRQAAFGAEDLAALEKIASQIDVALRNAKLVTDLGELFIGTIRSIAVLVDSIQPWTGGHSQRVAAYSAMFGRELELDDKSLKDLEVAALLHDIGKIEAEDVVRKEGPLTPEETKKLAEGHARSVGTLSSVKQLGRVIPVIRHVHERYDGRGYPDGLSGRSIPLLARILALAEAVDAMASGRPYKKAMSMPEIASEVKAKSGTQFDPRVVSAFLKVYAAA